MAKIKLVPLPINRKEVTLHYSSSIPAADVKIAVEAMNDLTGLASVKLVVTPVSDAYITRLRAIGNRDGRTQGGHRQLALEKPKQRQTGMYATFMTDLVMAANPKFGVLFFDDDIYAPGTNFVIGVSGKDMGTVISSWRFSGLDPAARAEVLKTGFMHEYGHIFGLAESGPRVVESLGSHCSNVCIMRQGLDMSEWMQMTADRLNKGALCNECKTDLVRYFWKMGQQ